VIPVVTRVTFKAYIVKIHRRFSLILVIVLLALGSVAGAQQAGSLHGTVIVISGAPLPQAMVTVEGTGGGQAASTDMNGHYTMRGLTPGDYAVKVAATGFEPFEVKITVGAGADVEADAVLTAERKPEPPPTAASEPSASQSQNAVSPAQAPQPAAAPARMVQAAPPVAAKPEKGRSALYGSIADQSGAFIPGAAVTLTYPGRKLNVPGNAQGQYVFNNLAPGQYKVAVTAQGFSQFETDVTLTADQGLEIDATLQPLGEKTEVNVSASTVSQVQTESAHLEGTITEKEVDKIGLNGRNFSQLVALAPGVSNQTGQDEAKVGVAGSVKYSVNGGRVEYNNFDVDGSDVLNAGLNGAESTLMVYPSLDSIQEVKVLTSNYGAMYGRTASGTVIVTTKSGTPAIHGNAYDFVRNEFINARNYFDPLGRAPLYRRQDFGGTLGGPLIIPGVFNQKKDKTFFFWSEEFRLEKSPLGPGAEPGDFNQAVPTLQERGIGVNQSFCPTGNASGCADFSDVCPIGGGTINRALYPDCPQAGAGSAFVNNLVPIDANSYAILQSGLIPLPNSTTGCNSSLANTVNPITGQPVMPCYVAAISPATYWREELFRLDQNFSQNERLSFRYIHDSWDTTVPTPLWGYVQNSFPTVQNRLNGPGTSMVVRLTSTLSPSLLNEFVVSYADSNITLANRSAEGGSLQPIANNCPNTPCLGSIFNNGLGGKPPGLVIAGTNAQYGGHGFVADPSYAPWEHTNPTYSLAENMSKVIGRHTLEFGVQVVDAQRSETNGAIGAATGDLQGLLTFSNQNNPGTSGNAFADFLNGPNGTDNSHTVNAIQSYQQDSAQPKYYNDYWIYEPYVQDDWKVNSRLTVNLGLRLSLFENFQEKNHNAYNWELSAYQAFNTANPALAASVQIAPTAVPGGTAGFYQGGYLEVGGQPFQIDPTNPTSSVMNSVVTRGLVQCGVNGIPATCMSSHLFNPAPRVGFAWDPKGDAKTSIRGGYGIFFEHGTAKEANTGSLEGSAPLDLTMTSIFPGSYSNIGLDNSGQFHVAYPLDVTSIPTKTIWPYAQQWSFSVQRQLTKDIVATVAYVGSKGTHLSAELQLNQLNPVPNTPDIGIFPTGNPFAPGQPLITYFITNQNSATGVCNSYTGGLNGSGNGYTPGNFTVGNVIVTPQQPAWDNLVAACYGSTMAVKQAPTPSPNSLRTFASGFQRVLSLQNIADSQYHALQATIRRTHGPLTVGASYTYSHSLDDSSDRSDASFVNSENIRQNWASSSFDERHLLNVSYVFDLPKISGAVGRTLLYRDSQAPPPDATDATATAPNTAPGQSGAHWLRVLLDGWQISGVTTFQSGTPFTVINGGSSAGISSFDNAGVANGAGDGSYPDVVGNPRSALPSYVPKFNAQSVGPLLYNPAAFVAPQGLTFGDAGRNFLNNPHRLDWDMSLLKNFKITEASNLEFRLEGFNVFNHTQFRIFNPNIGNTASNTISCYGGPNFSAAGGLTVFAPGLQAQPIDCTTGSSFLHPVDSHRPRTLQLGLKYSF